MCNVDELFQRDELSAAPDPGWPDCFNSGVFVFRPSTITYANLLDHALQHGSFDGNASEHCLGCKQEKKKTLMQSHVRSHETT